MAAIESLVLVSGFVLLIGMVFALMKINLGNLSMVVGMLMGLLIVGSILPSALFNQTFAGPYGGGLQTYYIDSCQNISSPGNYILTADLDGNESLADCFYITTSDVSIDCDGHAISNTTYDLIEIEAPGSTPLSDIEIYNCDFDCLDVPTVYAIETDTVIDSSFHDNDVQNCDEGIALWETNSTLVYNNAIVDCGEGINLDDCYFNTISNNGVSDSVYDGIYLEDSENNSILHNDLQDNEYGISMDTANNNTFNTNTVNNSGTDDFYCFSSDTNFEGLPGNVCGSQSGCGAWLSTCP